MLRVTQTYIHDTFLRIYLHTYIHPYVQIFEYTCSERCQISVFDRISHLRLVHSKGLAPGALANTYKHTCTITSFPVISLPLFLARSSSSLTQTPHMNKCGGPIHPGALRRPRQQSHNQQTYCVPGTDPGRSGRSSVLSYLLLSSRR